MFVGALTYVLFIVPLLYLNGIFLYISSSILGVGAAIFWTAQVYFPLHIFINTRGQSSNILQYFGQHRLIYQT